MKNKNNLLAIALILCIAVISIGCIGTSEEVEHPGYPNPTPVPQPTVDIVAIFDEADRLRNECSIEIRVGNDILEMIMAESPDSRIHDKNDAMLLVEQRQRQDVVCQPCIDYLRKHRYILDNGNKLNWASDTIEGYDNNKIENEVWYREVENYFGVTIIRPDLSPSPTPSPTATPTWNNSTALPTPMPTQYFGPIGQRELVKEFDEKMYTLTLHVEAMKNEFIIASNSMSCTSDFKKSIIDCRNYIKYFRFWVYENRHELKRAGVPVDLTNAMFEEMLLVCDQMDAACVQLQSISNY